MHDHKEVSYRCAEDATHPTWSGFKGEVPTTCPECGADAQLVDSNGNPVLDENGNPVLDSNGDVVRNANVIPSVNANGDPLLDSNGNPVLDSNGFPLAGATPTFVDPAIRARQPLAREYTGETNPTGPTSGTGEVHVKHAPGPFSGMGKVNRKKHPGPVALYKITGLVDIFDVQGVIRGQYALGSEQELSVVEGDKAVELGNATKVE